MFERRPDPNAFRGFLVAASLALLAGCNMDGSSSAINQSPSADSGQAAPPTSAVQASVPTVPANLTATSGNGSVELSWTASSGATGYDVKRSTTKGGPYTQVATATPSSFTDTAVTNSVIYYYVVSAANAAGQSADSAEVSVIPDPTITIPPVPTGVTAIATDAKVALSWNTSSGATVYQVNRSTTSGGPFTQVGTPNSNAYTDTSVSDGTRYYYVVSAADSAGHSANSSQVSALPAATVSNPPPTTFGTWANATPSNVNLTDGDCGNFGTITVQEDPAHPSNLYTTFFCQGIWKSTDFGVTWTGPINTGTNGATAGDCAGGITIPPSSTTSVPTIYQACIRGAATGFWRSLDGGVSWTKYFVAPSGSSRQDYYPPVVDPYDSDHLLMAGHEMDVLVESVDGGQTWANVSMASGMMETGGTGAIFFINTGNSSTTRGTWLWMAQQSGGTYGTWRTADSGGTWVQVDKNEHSHGAAQIYQPDNNGVVYMCGAYSILGWGVLRSTDYGKTWSHVGNTGFETVVIGTPKNVYSMLGYPAVAPALEMAAQPGTGTWVTPGTPASLVQGPAQMAVVNDGAHNILIGAMWVGGIWRYVEP